MNKDTRQMLRVAVAQLRQERDQCDAALAALIWLLGEPDAETAKAPARTAPAARRVAPTPPKGRKAAASDTKRRRAVANGRDWQADALRALAMGPGDAQVRELATRLRLAGPDRDHGLKSLWAALQALVAAGQVVRNGPRYTLAASNGAQA